MEVLLTTFFMEYFRVSNYFYKYEVGCWGGLWNFVIGSSIYKSIPFPVIKVETVI